MRSEQVHRVVEAMRAMAAHSEATTKRVMFERRMPQTREALVELQGLWRAELAARHTSITLYNQPFSPTGAAPHESV